MQQKAETGRENSHSGQPSGQKLNIFAGNHDKSVAIWARVDHGRNTTKFRLWPKIGYQILTSDILGTSKATLSNNGMMLSHLRRRSTINMNPGRISSLPKFPPIGNSFLTSSTEFKYRNKFKKNLTCFCGESKLPKRINKHPWWLLDSGHFPITHAVDLSNLCQCAVRCYLQPIASPVLAQKKKGMRSKEDRTGNLSGIPLVTQSIIYNYN